MISAKKINEEESERLAGYLRECSVEAVFVSVHCYEKEALDEVASMLSPFLSLPGFTWDVMCHDPVVGKDSYMIVHYSITIEKTKYSE